MAYIIMASGHEERFSKRADAVACAVDYAKKRSAQSGHDEGVEVWARPFWAVAVVRHYPVMYDLRTGDLIPGGETLLHKFDRYGREQPGDTIS
jgi:hypothetical protein